MARGSRAARRARANAPPAIRGRTHATMTQPDRAHRPQDPGVEPRAAPPGRRPGRAPSRWRSSRRSGARSRRRPVVACRRAARAAATAAGRRAAPDEEADARAMPPARAARRARRPRGHREQRRGAARERVHDRQVAPPVGRGEEHEVRDLHRAGGQPDEPRLGRDRRLPVASQPSATNGTTTTLEATTPAVAVRSGSPAVLSRMFHAAWRTAAMAIEDERGGVHAASLGRARGGPDWHGAGDARRRAADAGAVSAGRRAGSTPQVPSRSPPTAIAAAAPSRPVPQADHRVAEVGGQRELLDPVGQLERRHDGVDDERERSRAGR